MSEFIQYLEEYKKAKENELEDLMQKATDEEVAYCEGVLTGLQVALDKAKEDKIC